MTTHCHFSLDKYLYLLVAESGDGGCDVASKYCGKSSKPHYRSFEGSRKISKNISSPSTIRSKRLRLKRKQNL